MLFSSKYRDLEARVERLEGLLKVAEAMSNADQQIIADLGARVMILEMTSRPDQTASVRDEV